MGDVGGRVAPMLQVTGVDASYGALQVLFDVELTVDRGETVALLGTNGAGKSTLLKVVAGLLQPDCGTVTFDGSDVTRLPAWERSRAGLALVEGGRAAFPSLTTRENILLGATRRVDREVLGPRLDDVLTLFPHLRPKLALPAGTLSGGEQQMVALARALLTQPALLLIDELSLGLAPVVLQEIAAVIEELPSRGTTLVLVEQSLNVAAALTHVAHFMEKGEIRFSGATTELLERGDLARAVFLGGARGRTNLPGRIATRRRAPRSRASVRRDGGSHAHDEH